MSATGMHGHQAAQFMFAAAALADNASKGQDHALPILDYAVY